MYNTIQLNKSLILIYCLVSPGLPFHPERREGSILCSDHIHSLKVIVEKGCLNLALTLLNGKTSPCLRVQAFWICLYNWGIAYWKILPKTKSEEANNLRLKCFHLAKSAIVYIYIYMRSALVYQVTLQLSFKYGILSIFVLNVICKFIIPV